MTASILQQLLALYLAIIYSWQVLSSEEFYSGKKFIHISQAFYRLRFFFFIFFSFFFIFFDKCLFTLSVTQNVCCTKSSQPFCWLGDTKTVILTKFENLNFILNIFQETRDFLVFTDPVIICIYF